LVDFVCFPLVRKGWDFLGKLNRLHSECMHVPPNLPEYSSPIRNSFICLETLAAFKILLISPEGRGRFRRWHSVCAEHRRWAACGWVAWRRVFSLCLVLTCLEARELNGNLVDLAHLFIQ
jgi:hypothetical protein